MIRIRHSADILFTLETPKPVSASRQGSPKPEPNPRDPKPLGPGVEGLGFRALNPMPYKSKP